MSKYFMVGDLVRIPQGTSLFTLDNNVYYYNNACERNVLGIFAGQDDNVPEWGKVIISNYEFHVNMCDIHEGDSYVSSTH